MFVKILEAIIAVFMIGIILFLGIGTSIFMLLDDKKKEDK